MRTIRLCISGDVRLGRLLFTDPREIAARFCAVLVDAARLLLESDAFCLIEGAAFFADCTQQEQMGEPISRGQVFRSSQGDSAALPDC